MENGVVMNPGEREGGKNKSKTPKAYSDRLEDKEFPLRSPPFGLYSYLHHLALESARFLFSCGRGWQNGRAGR